MFSLRLFKTNKDKGHCNRHLALFKEINSNVHVVTQILDGENDQEEEMVQYQIYPGNCKEKTFYDALPKGMGLFVICEGKIIGKTFAPDSYIYFNPPIHEHPIYLIIAPDEKDALDLFSIM